MIVIPAVDIVDFLEKSIRYPYRFDVVGVIGQSDDDVEAVISDLQEIASQEEVDPAVVGPNRYQQPDRIGNGRCRVRG